MLYEGQPIDPECVYAASKLEGMGTSVNLSECMKHRPQKIAYKSRSALEVGTDGRRGYSYGKNDNPADRDETLERSYEGYFYYKYIGQQDGALILQTFYSGGGSGHIVKLSEYVREGEVLRLRKHIKTGDRCGYSVTDAAIEDNVLRYIFSVTPAGIWDTLMPEGGGYSIGLSSAPMDCAAEIYMRGEQVEKVSLNIQDTQANHVGAPCFENIYNQTRDAHNGVLTGDQARAMMLRFKAECAENP